MQTDKECRLQKVERVPRRLGQMRPKPGQMRLRPGQMRRKLKGAAGRKSWKLSAVCDAR